MRPFRWLVVVFAVAFWIAFGAVSGVALAQAPAAEDDGHIHAAQDPKSVSQYTVVPGAAELEATLLAPCCYTQTLDNHNSDLAAEVRREIRARLVAGQDVPTVRAAMVQRYGEKIVALPEDSPLGTFALLLGVGVCIAGLLAALALIRWSRRGKEDAEREDSETDAPGRTGEPGTTGERDDLDRRLDEELEDDD